MRLGLSTLNIVFFKFSSKHIPIYQDVLFLPLLYGQKDLEKLNERIKIRNKKLLGERGSILKFYQLDSGGTPLVSLPGNFQMKWSQGIQLQWKAPGTDNLSSITISKWGKGTNNHSYFCCCCCCCVTAVTLTASRDISFISKNLQIITSFFPLPIFVFS